MNKNSKNSHTQESIIIEFCLLVKSIFKDEIIAVQTNEKYHYLISQLDKKAQSLVQILTHHLTQLYQNHRVQRTKNVIEIADEDVLTALKIIEALHLNTIENKTHLSKINRNYYLKIVENYNDSLFKSSELQSCLNLSKSQINELLNLFLEHHLIERYGHKNKGFYYKIIQIRTQQIPEKTKQYNDIFDDFTDFNDNENIEYQYRKDNFRF